MILKQQRRQLPAQVPLDIIGEHAKQFVAVYRGFAVDIYRAKIKIGFQATECAFDLAQALVGLDCLNRADGGRIQAGADHIDAIQAAFRVNARLASLLGKATLGDLDVEVLCHFPFSDLLLNASSDVGRAVQCGVFASDCGGNVAQHRFGGVQQLLSIAPLVFAAARIQVDH